MRRLRRPTLRDRLLMLAAEWELYADHEQVGRARRAYKDAAAALRRELRKITRATGAPGPLRAKPATCSTPTPGRR